MICSFLKVEHISLVPSRKEVPAFQGKEEAADFPGAQLSQK
jgi:hypothetical protein